MSFWITSHWAHPEPDDLPWHIYRRKLDKRDREISVGDQVLFFEGLRPRRDGKRVESAERVQAGKRTGRYPLRRHRAGIVCAGSVRENARKLAPHDVIFDYGDLSGWHYIIPCEIHARGGPVSLADIERVLNRKVPPHTMGLLRIEEPEYRELLKCMTSGC
jgi:hypothetical protein